MQESRLRRQQHKENKACRRRHDPIGQTSPIEAVGRTVIARVYPYVLRIASLKALCDIREANYG